VIHLDFLWLIQGQEITVTMEKITFILSIPTFLSFTHRIITPLRMAQQAPNRMVTLKYRLSWIGQVVYLLCIQLYNGTRIHTHTSSYISMLCVYAISLIHTPQNCVCAVPACGQMHIYLSIEVHKHILHYRPCPKIPQAWQIF
jgi:hypothetical protein